jgi:hypothetical protein
MYAFGKSAMDFSTPRIIHTIDIIRILYAIGTNRLASPEKSGCSVNFAYLPYILASRQVDLAKNHLVVKL